MKALESLLSLQGKTAIITGGAVNIGRAITLKLAQAGARLVVLYHNSQNEAKSLSEILEKEKVPHIMLHADLNQENEIIKAMKKAVEHFGKVDVLVNNSGVFGLSMQEELNEKEWDKIFDLNVKGLFVCSREVIKYMKQNESGGTLINIASINGFHPGFGKTAHYDASKGAVIAYTKSLAAEIAKYNIRVNAVAPGLVDSANLRKYAGELAETVEKRTPLQKIASPEDIANAVLFLAAGISSHITGEVLVVDGGYLLT